MVVLPSHLDEKTEFKAEKQKMKEKFSSYDESESVLVIQHPANDFMLHPQPTVPSLNYPSHVPSPPRLLYRRSRVGSPGQDRVPILFLQTSTYSLLRLLISILRSSPLISTYSRLYPKSVSTRV